MRSPAGNSRRLVGALVLLLAVAGVMVASRVSGPLVAGHPVADWPQPPVVGSCLDLDGTESRAVPCDGPHDAEVTRTFGALDPMATAMSQDPVYDACAEAANTVVGISWNGTDAGTQLVPGHPGWYLPPIAFSAHPVYAPPGERVGKNGWVACVIAPVSPVRYTGTIRGSTANTRPAAYGVCFNGGGGPVSCTTAHATQVLASVQEQFPGDQSTGGANPAAPPATSTVTVLPGIPVPEGEIAAVLAKGLAKARANAARQRAAELPVRNEQCREVAASQLGTDDPTYGGVLAVGVHPGGDVTISTGTVMAADSGPADAAPQLTPIFVVIQRQCVIKAADGRLLADSMVGWGDRPPPLTGG